MTNDSDRGSGDGGGGVRCWRGGASGVWERERERGGVEAGA
jgi:hypothetical protein